MFSRFSKKRNLEAELAELRAELADARDTLHAIQTGEVDALVVETQEGPKIYTLQGQDAALYRFQSEILAQISDAVIVVDQDENVTYLNAAAEKQYQVAASHILGRPITELYKSAWFEPEHEAQAKAMLQNKGQWRGENIHIKHNGDRIYAESAVIRLHSPASQNGFLAVIRDISERKRIEIQLRQSESQARARQEELETLISAIPAAVFLANDPQCLNMTGNPMATALLDLPPGANPSTSFEENPTQTRFSYWSGHRCVPPDELPMQRAAASGKPITGVELRIEFEDGRSKYIFGSAVPLFNPDGEVRGCIGVYLDITQNKQTTLHLLEKERLLTESQAIARIGSWEDDLQSGLLSWTDETLRLYGLSSPQPVQYNFEQFLALVHPDDRPAMQAWNKAFLSGQAQPGLEFRVCRADGSMLWLQGQGKLETGANGEALRLVGTVQDISERKQIEEDLLSVRETFRNLVENSPFGIYVIDQDFKLVHVSAGAQKIFINFQPLLGRDFIEIIRKLWFEPFASDTIARFRHTLETGEPYHSPKSVEQRYDINAVEAYDWQIERIRLPDGRHGVVCNFYDLSERQRYEEILNAQKEALREADRQKDEFLAMLGHELRNPLTPISNVTEILCSKKLDVLTLDWASDLLKRNVSHITKLVDDLLDISRITHGQITLTKERLDLIKLIKDAAESMQGISEAKQQTLSLDLPSEPVYLEGDPVRLTQVFVNLLNNAAKYNHEGGRINLHARSEDAAIRVVVQDDGQGIEPQLLPKIFDLFIQGKRGLDRSQGGLGLGLTLVKRLVSMHGGEITAHSAGVNQGSRFEVTLPLPAETTTHHESMTASETQPATGQTVKILLIDDNEDLVESSCLWLKMMGYNVEIARTGTQGISAAQHFKPDVILLDIGLPDLTGYEVAKAIKQQPGAGRMLIVGLSGYVPEEKAIDNAGFDHYLIKPPNLTELRALISQHEQGKSERP